MIEAILQEVIVALTTQAITKAAGPVGRAIGLLKPTNAPDWLTASLLPSVTAAVRAMLADPTNSAIAEANITKAAAALRSPQAQQLQRMLIVSVITQKQTELSNLASQLTAILTYLGGCTPDDAERIANSLAPMLLAAAVRGVEIFQKNSDKYYGVLRQLALQERAAGAIESLLATTGVPYKPPTPEDLTEVHDFVRTYLREMIARNADLVPQHFDMQTRVPIDKLYVAPCFQALGDEVGRLMPMSADANPYAPEVIFPMAHALRRMYRAVVLGSPGAGKTTLTQKIIHDLCTIPHIGDICVPFLVVLRKYEQSRPESHSSFVDYLAEYITSQLQIPVAPKTIHYLLAAGKAMVIFDGLDELLHLDRRVDISDAIQSFGRRYPESSILVTSRIIGYERAPLDRRMFLHMRLTNFDDAGVKTYVDNWFALNAGLDPSERLRVAKSFLEESASASEYFAEQDTYRRTVLIFTSAVRSCSSRNGTTQGE